MNDVEVVRDGYDLVSYAYRPDDGLLEGNYARWVPEFLEALQPNDSVLDLGCGCGIPVTRVLSTRQRVTGVDLSPVRVRRARKLIPEARFICANMCDLDLPPNSFRGIIALYSIIHVPCASHQALLARIATWLEPGGVFVATLGATAWTGSVEDWLGVRGATMFWSHFGADTYRGWLVDVGLDIKHEEYVRDGQGAGRVREIVSGHQHFRAERTR